MTTYETVSSKTAYSGRIFDVDVDEVRFPDGTQARRDVVRKTGAVAIVAYDGDGRIGLIHQYRHPLGKKVWELPAGLLDVLGESPLEAAKRELIEETGYEGQDWRLICDLATSPGFTDETTQVFVAGNTKWVGRPDSEAEEADIEFLWLPIDEALKWVAQGKIVSASAVAGICAAVAYSFTYADLRSAE